MEQVKADCMKQSGFTYVHYIAPRRPDADQSTYEAMKTYRQKYGFGVYAQYVYPDDPLSGSIQSAEAELKSEPNETVLGRLNNSQLDSCNKALRTCHSKAAKEVLNKKVGSMLEGINLMKKAKEELDGDPELVTLASDLADCLTAKGRRVPSTKPTALARRGFDTFWAQSEKSGDTPDLPSAQAKPYLDKEVSAALEDLECGKEFYTRFAPAKASIEARVWGEYGPLIGR